jgi:hypothetical protein
MKEGPTKAELAQAILSLLEKGLIVDSGERRNGQIVWVAAPTKQRPKGH